jgi:hypothetical protein
MKKKASFDQHLASQLVRIAFVKMGKFTSTDVKERLKNSNELRKLYKKEYKATWAWDDFNDRLNGHIYRVVQQLGGDREKVNNRWVYSVSPALFSVHTSK